MISIIILTYNRVELLKQCIDSIRAQTYKDYEIIIIDNNSKDLTYKYCSDIKNTNIRYFNIGDRNNIAYSRNEGICKSNGEYIAYCDDDDYWHPEKLQTQIKYINDYNFICSNGKAVDINGKIVREIYYPDFKKSLLNIIEITPEKLLTKNYILTPSVLFRKNILTSNSPFDEINYGNLAEDYDVWLKISMENRILFINDPLVSIRMHENISYDKKLRIKMLNNTLDIVGSYRNNKNSSIKQNADIGYLRFSFILMYNLKAARNYFSIFKLGLKLLSKFSIFKIIYNYYNYKKFNKKISA